MKTYNIYTLVCKGRDGQWIDLEGHGCWEDEARAAAKDWQAKGATVALRIDTYKRSKTLTPPVATKQVSV